jgi:hypothetical protein
VKSRITHKALLLLALAGTACNNDFDPKTPKGFVAFDTSYANRWWQHEDKDPEYDYRATSPDGVNLAVRRFKNDPQGDVAYWSDAIVQRLAAYGTYSLTSSRDITNHQGYAGREITLKHSAQGSEHLYRVAVYDRKGWLYVIESGGDTQKMSNWSVALDEAVTGISIN